MLSGIVILLAGGVFPQPVPLRFADTVLTPVAAAYARLGPSNPQGQRPKAREYSPGFYTRLSIHKYASYATIPLFGAEYFVGQKLYNDTTTRGSSLKGVHSALALGIGALFAVNTVTGVWNLWEQRQEPAGRARRYVHAFLMLASDAGFLATAATAPGGRDRVPGQRAAGASTHRTLAMTSFSAATVGYLLMLIWK